MKALIALHQITVQNANAVSGLTWGFPSLSHFLGFVHALDRRLRVGTNLNSLLTGCAVICHQHQTHAQADKYGQYSFSLTRNPLTKKGETAPFNEEGRMHMTLTLLIECQLNAASLTSAYDGETSDQYNIEADKDWIEHHLQQMVSCMRLAGGVITDIEKIQFIDSAADLAVRETQHKKLLYQCLPGFALVDRQELLAKHLETLQQQDAQADILDAWMDFAGLRYRAQTCDPAHSCEWSRVELPEKGWFVPQLLGYQAIAALQPAGSVASTRDLQTPYCAVEAVYGVAQWLSPVRAPCLESLFWRYQYQESGHYQLSNLYNTFNSNTTGA